MSRQPKPTRRTITVTPAFDVGESVMLRSETSPRRTGTVLEMSGHQFEPGAGGLILRYHVRFGDDPDDVVICPEFEIEHAAQPEPYGFKPRSQEQRA